MFKIFTHYEPPNNGLKINNKIHYNNFLNKSLDKIIEFIISKILYCNKISKNHFVKN